MTIGSVKKEFKYLQDWIQWHLDDDRAECIFQAARDHDGIRGHGDDTNAQEGCGKWIKRGFGPKGSKPSLSTTPSRVTRRRAEKEGIVVETFGHSYLRDKK